MILIIDNYDSFVHNLARYVRLLGHPTMIIRNDKITLNEVETINPRAIIISPGPCSPNEAGMSLEIINFAAGRYPLLGICLGHQAIVQVFGGIVKQGDPYHGMSSQITHDGSALFHNIPHYSEVGRYHSLICEIDDSCPLITSAKTNDGINMAVRHKDYPIFGLQFHPESILTEQGSTYIKNFLRVCDDNN